MLMDSDSYSSSFQFSTVSPFHFDNVVSDIKTLSDLALPPFSLLRDFSFQNTFEHFAICFRQSYLVWEVSDVTAIESSS